MGELTKLWDFKADSEISSSLLTGTLEDGSKIVLFGTKKGTIYVLDNEANVKFKLEAPENNLGELESLFQDSEKNQSILATPVLADINKDGKIELIFCYSNGEIIVFDSDYKRLWSKNLKAEIKGKPLFTHEQLIIPLMNGNLVSLTPTGEINWIFKSEAPIEASPVLFDDKLAFGCDSGLFYVINMNGRQEWTFKTNGKIVASAVSAKIQDKEKLFFGSFDKMFYCLNQQGILEWKYPLKGRIASEAVVDDINADGKQEIIFGALDNNVYVLDETGNKLWSFETDFWIVAAPMVVNITNEKTKDVIVGSYDHKLYILDSEGSFIMDYVPGVSGATSQSGSYSELETSESGEYVGKKLMEYKAEDMIVGVSVFSGKEPKIVLATKNGKINTMLVKKKKWTSWLKKND